MQPVRVIWALPFALVLVSCTGGETPQATETSRSDDGAAATLPFETLPPVETVEPAATAAPSEDDDTAGAPRAASSFGPSFDPATDPYFQRQSRPILPVDPTETWALEVDRVTVPLVDDVGDVIVLRTVSPDDDQAILGLARADGTVVWTYDPDQTISSVAVVGDGVLVTLADTAGSGRPTVLLDGATGEELPLPTNDDFSPRGRFIGAVTIGTCSVRNYDPSTGVLVGEFCPVGAGPDTLVARVDESVVELDPLDFSAVSDPIPIDKLSEQRRVMVFGDTVVTYSLTELNLRNRDGALLATIPDPGEIMLEPAGVGSDVLIVHDYRVTVGLDVTTLLPVWQRPTFVDRFGSVDGDLVGTARGETTTEVFSLETGETRCVIDAAVVAGQNGFYERGGAAHDLDCAPRWTLDVDDGAELHSVDSGIVTVERTSDDTTLIRLLS